jgi:hypothetical protein
VDKVEEAQADLTQTIMVQAEQQTPEAVEVEVGITVLVEVDPV